MKTVICLIVAITLATVYLSEAQQETNGCNTNCSRDPKPQEQLCATNDEGKTKMFLSECFMKSENCVNKSKYAKSGPGPLEGGTCSL